MSRHDDNGSWEADRRYERDVQREPTHRRPRYPVSPDRDGTLRARFADLMRGGGRS